METSLPVTATELARETKVARYRINYCLARKGPKPAGKLGLSRYWPREKYQELVALVLDHASLTPTRK